LIGSSASGNHLKLSKAMLLLIHGKANGIGVLSGFRAKPAAT
jgi:hypothetical protein